MHLCDVLVVEDHPEMREVLCELLTDMDLIVRQAADGAEALVEMAAFRPRVVLLDMSLPVISGWDVFNAARQNAALANIPIIPMTEGAETPEAQLLKPFSSEELMNALALHLPELRQNRDTG